MKKLKLIAFVSLLALAAGAARAQDSALLDLLVKKKVITDQEAEETRSELAKEYASTSAGKINISAPVSQIRLYGDARVRYEWREGHSLAAGPSDTANADRFRYRLRIGADVTVTDNWFLGIRLETGNGPRSTNVTASNGGSSIAEFGKAGTATSSFVSTATTTTVKNKAGAVTSVTTTTKTGTAVTKVDFGNTIFLGQLYLKYTPFEWLTLEAGRIPNPFVSTPMVWDPDINPEGAAEQFKYTIGPFGGSADTTSADGKGGKSVTTPGEPGQLTVDLFGNFGQFAYDTATPQNQFGATVGRNDSWLFGYQVGAKVNFSKTTYFQLAPSFYNYSGKKNNDFATAFNGDPGGNQTGIDNLAVFDVPVEFGWEAFDLPFTLFGDFAYNVDGKDRATLAGHPGVNESAAYQAGLSVGKIKKKGDWQLLAYWQHSEQYSLDPNLIDDDIFDAHLNMQGVVVRVNYALTDAVTLGLSYNHGEVINTALGTGGAGGTLNGSSSTPALQNYNLIQADINLKF
jgi:hypothetical protein